MLSTTFVLSGLAALAAAAPAGHYKPKPAPKGPAINDITILNYALTLEYLEAEFYREGLAAFSDADFADAGLPDTLRPLIVEVANEEAAHAAFLATALGKKATKPCTYDFGLTDAKDFITKSFIIEGVGVSAYAGAAPLISNKGYLGYAAQILPIEARHAALVAGALGNDPVPDAYDTPLGLSPVYNLAAPFITSCPKSNPALPVMVFPALTASVDGNTVTVDFTPKKECKSKKFYAYVLNGLTSVAVPLNADNTFDLPAGVGGRVYLLITDSKTLCDASTVAGPTFLTLPSVFSTPAL